MKYAIIGDIGGHAELFEDCLTALGVEHEISYIPADLTVIQVGDLIDRGPDSDRVVEIVDSLIHLPNYVQLMGNHESKHLGGPEFYERNSTTASDAAIEVIKDWDANGYLNLSYPIVAKGQQYLITHAGLTWDQWSYHHNQCDDVCWLSEDINFGRDLRAGILLGDPPLQAGVTWADSWHEVICSYLAVEEEPPFNQIHGHSTLFDWNRNQSRVPEVFEEYFVVDKVKRHSKFYLGDSFVAQIDPALGQYSNWTIVPYMIED